VRAKRADDAVFVEDTLQPLGTVDVRALFGGFGVFLAGGCSVSWRTETSLTVDDENRRRFGDAGLGPFVSSGKHRPGEMSYRRAPEPIDDWSVLEPWARGTL
jgi:TfoX/Sxy family transcriptional regulator of competence genes